MMSVQKQETAAKTGRENSNTAFRVLRSGAGFLVLTWAAAVLVFTLTTHPCWSSSRCLALLVWGDDSGRADLQRTSVGSGVPEHEEPTELHHVVFGIAASANQWWHRRDYVGLWWQPGRTRGHVWLDRPVNGSEGWDAGLGIPLRVSEDTSRFKFTHPEGVRSAVRVARIVTETFRLGLPNVRWFVMGDDDTVFFTENLLRVLGRYDHRKHYYIGSNSESVDQNAYHSFNMAYGGGGFAVSYPLAQALSEILDGCIDRYHNLYGSDQRVQACLSELGVPMTREPGFHQFDVRGNLFGLLSAHPVTPVISFHHLDSVSPIFPNRTRLKALQHLMQPYTVDPGRLLQQSICYEPTRNRTFSVSWGYCVQIYKGMILPRALEFPLRTFVSWGQSGRPYFMFNTRAVPRDACERPTVLFLEQIAPDTAVEETSISSYTMQMVDPKAHNCPADTSNTVKDVTVFSHEGPLNWTEGRRRTCCDVVASSEKSLELRVRNCRHKESLVPPFDLQ